MLRTLKVQVEVVLSFWTAHFRKDWIKYSENIGFLDESEELFIRVFNKFFIENTSVMVITKKDVQRLLVEKGILMVMIKDNESV